MKQEIIRIDARGVNCYLGKEGDSYILFDTGGHLFMDKQFNNRREEIEKELEMYGCNADNLKLIVLTHGDNDHVANAEYFRKRFNTKIAMHPEDVALVDHPTLDKLMENTHYKSAVYKVVYVLIKKFLKELMKKILEDYESFQPSLLLEDGFDLSEYGFHARVIHVPGHTNGSIVILTQEGDLISGDIFANMGKPSVAPNASNFKVLKRSAEKIKSLNIRTIYPGHGSPFNASEMQSI